MADSASGQGKANPVFWLDLSFPTGRSPTTFSFWPCNKSFIDQACSVKVAGYAVADPDLRGGFQKQIFRPFGPHFALNIRGAGWGGGAGLPGPFPGSAADMGLVLFALLWISTLSRSIKTRRQTWPICSSLDQSRLVNKTDLNIYRSEQNHNEFNYTQ